MRRRTMIACTLFVVLCAPRALTAQGVKGVVTALETGAPLAGVWVTLLNPDGERLGATLTDASGRYALVGRAGRRVRVRAERIGLATSWSDWVTLVPGRFQNVDLTMGYKPVEVSGLVVTSPARTCAVDQSEAVVIQRWWTEARKALEASTLVSARTPLRFRIYDYRREWSADLRSLVWERGTRRTAYSTSPYIAIDTESLHEHGYVQGPRGERSFYGPDATVLLSDQFLSSHCFRTERTDTVSRYLGLHFEPMRDRDLPDISGVLWIDTLSATLRDLRFVYVNLPEDIPWGEAGGQVRFRHLPSGEWIVSEWWIRVPKVGTRRERRGRETSDVSVVVGYQDTGGRAERATSQDRDLALQEDQWGSIHGVVYDSLRGGPREAALVVVSGTGLATRTDASGRFVLEGLPAGTHRIVVHDDRLSELGLPSPTATVDVAADSVTEVSMALPGYDGMATRLCPDSERIPRTVLAGRVVDEDGIGFPDALIEARWNEGDPLSRMRRSRVKGATTGSDGRFVLCSVPEEVPVTVFVRVGERWQPVLEVVLRAREVSLHTVAVHD